MKPWFDKPWFDFNLKRNSFLSIGSLSSTRCSSSMRRSGLGTQRNDGSAMITGTSQALISAAGGVFRSSFRHAAFFEERV